MSKALAKFKRNKKADVYERAAEVSRRLPDVFVSFGSCIYNNKLFIY